MWRDRVRQRAASLCKRAADDEQLAEAVEVVYALAYDYTRGRGFPNGVPTPTLRSVIVTGAARLAGNPDQSPTQFTVGAVTERRGAGFIGWSLAELAVLNRYRRTAL